MSIMKLNGEPLSVVIRTDTTLNVKCDYSYSGNNPCLPNATIVIDFDDGGWESYACSVYCVRKLVLEVKKGIDKERERLMAIPIPSGW